MEASYAAVRPNSRAVGRTEAVSKASRMILSAGLFLVLVCAAFSVRYSKSNAVFLEERAGSEEPEPSSTDEVCPAR
jgi:hypothetical protein